ncbi:MAG TPA: SAM-dependent methyltransferase [Streptosporangiaceae bacterium]|nr:SAM-dependent methyltransferase [Streptosporangiaceae bacterium]
MPGEWSREAVLSGGEPGVVDSSVAHCARVYDYWLGGKDNFALDRAAGEQAKKAFPGIVVSARANRGFLARAVRFLAGEVGIRQFLDIGTGIPTRDNTHEIAQRAAPQSRVVYADNDPIVLTHARALLASGPEGTIDYLDADLRDPRKILDAAGLLLDVRRPVAVLLMAVLQHIDDADDPYAIVGTLMAALPRGSYLALSHPASDISARSVAKMADVLSSVLAEQITFRDRTAVARFFQGMELLDPGIVRASQWRPATGIMAAGPAAIWAGLARKT